jgi:acyl-CoA dehydrogenase
VSPGANSLLLDDQHRAIAGCGMDLDHLNWPFFQDEHRELAERFSAWVSANLAVFEADEGGDGRVARVIFELLARDRWLDMSLPRRGDGRERLDLRAMSIIRERCAYSSAISDVAISEPWLGILPIALFGSGELKRKYLPGYLAGKLLPAFALSEPDAGSDAAAITATARRDGDYYLLNGRKTWTSNSGLADLYVVFARLEETGAISAFAVDGHAEGIVLEERFRVLSPHTVGTWALNDCRVPLDHCIGEPGQGLKIALAVLGLFRPTVGAAAVGFARRAFFEAVARSIERTAFKKPIAEHQLIQSKLAGMAARIDSSALLVYRASWQHDCTAKDSSRAAAIAKWQATEAACSIIDEALQIFGGRGVLYGTAVERLYRHARAFRIFDGTSEIQQLIIARDLLNHSNRAGT